MAQCKRMSPQTLLPRLGGGGTLLWRGVVLAMLLLSGPVKAQTLARPGWAGSGITVERWWPHSVLYEIAPDSLASESRDVNASVLLRLASRLDDLQTLGVDALLLRGLEPGAQTNLRTRSKITLQASPQSTCHDGDKAAETGVRIDQRYGSLDDFDQLLSDASRHSLRVLVELPQEAYGAGLLDDARFWLSRGAAGLLIGSDDTADIRAIRAILHSYVGERVLIVEKDGAAGNAVRRGELSEVRANPPAASAHPVNGVTDLRPDLVRVALPPVSKGAAAMRAALGQALTMGGHPPVPLLSSEPSTSDIASARVMATVLLGSGGAVLLRAENLDLTDPAATSTASSVFNWYRQWSSLRRGNAILRSGQDILLDHDAEGALVWVRTSTRGAMPIVAICNPTGNPLHLSLLSDIQRLRLRGSFLRALIRWDGGMGAMPLRNVVLPPFGVYVGELSR